MCATLSDTAAAVRACSGTLQYAVRAKMIVTNPKANYDLDKDAPMEEEVLCSVCMQAAKQSHTHSPHTLPPFPASGDDKEGPRVPLPPPVCEGGE